MTDDGKLQKGEDALVFVTYRGRTMVARPVLVSDNGESAMIQFDGMLGGYLGMMPISFDAEASLYRDLIEHDLLVVTPYPS